MKTIRISKNTHPTIRRLANRIARLMGFRKATHLLVPRRAPEKSKVVSHQPYALTRWGYNPVKTVVVLGNDILG